MLLNVVFASPAPPLPSFSTSHTIFAIASLVFAVEEFKIHYWKAEDNTNQRKKRKLKSDHYSLRNRVIYSIKSKSRSKVGHSFVIAKTKRINSRAGWYGRGVVMPH